MEQTLQRGLSMDKNETVLHSNDTTLKPSPR
nr:MAG TPA: hypothetical protein [Caudoviricetes sp.]